MSRMRLRDLPRLYTATLLWSAIGTTISVVLLVLERT